MSPRRTSVLLGALAIASAFAFAQTPPPSPTDDNTSPSAASSPHQRDATSSQAPEAPAANGAEPASASTPHQQQATSHKQMMKDCIAKENAKNSGMSKDEVKKTCKEQLKASPNP